MNTPNPLVPQGSLLEQPKSKSKSNLFIAVFVILAIHVVLFTGLLVQGCRREKPSVMQAMESTNTPPAETSYVPTPSLPATPANNYATTTSTPPAVSSVSAPPLTTPTSILETSEPAGPTQNYTVVKGDFFAKIAKAHGITVTALVKANPKADARKLHVGQILQLPAANKSAGETASLAAKPTAEGAAPASETSAYTVKAGDNLTRVAKAHATTVVAIRKANNLKTDQLHVGQKLKLPPPKSPKTAEPVAPATPAPVEPARPATMPASANTSSPARM
jgi:N-acetylmuramoyl-L-alanine amidase